MPSARAFRFLLIGLVFACALPAAAAVVTATWNIATDVPVSASSYTATGNTVNFTLNFAPPTGTNLTVVSNTGLPFISGAFDNLSQGQAVALSYGGITYNYVAHYFGGTGNDLVLVWANNRAFAWGYNGNGTIGDGTNTQRNVMVPVTATGVLAGKTILAFAKGNDHCLILCSDGTVLAWGSNLYGQLGNNTTTSSNVPVVVNTASGVSALYGKTVVSIAAGLDYSMALCSDGTVVNWGNYYFGQLGNNNGADSHVPVAVNTTSGVSALYGKTVVAIASRYYHCLALCSDGTLAAWGYNSDGELGDNSTIQRNVPIAVNTGSGVSALYGKTVIGIGAGTYHSLALCSDGTVASWGYNSYGQLGDNTTTQRNAPVAVNTTSGVSALNGKNVVALAAGDSCSMALCGDGTVAAWGNNNYGQLGNNSLVQSKVPVAVNTTSGVSALFGKTVVAIGIGGFYWSSSTALCSDGTLTNWGANGQGDLGNNSTTDSAVPLAVNTSPLAPRERLANYSRGGYLIQTMVLAAAPPPTLTTLAATAVAGTSATLNGRVNANSGTGVTVTFEYGLTTAYGSTAASIPATVTGGSDTAVSATLSGLIPGTIYHYRVNAAGFTGNDQTLLTLSSDASLASLTTSAGNLSPVFASNTPSYSAPDSAGALVTITPTLTESHATVRVNGINAVSGSPCTVNMGLGSNIINVQVTAQDGVTQRSYTLTIPCSAPTAVTVAWSSGSDVPMVINNITATGSTVNFSLNYAPVTGASLMVVNNTGAAFISGTFDNLAQGQAVALSYGGVTYNYVAHYFGGTGNDLVLVWANNRAFAWGYNFSGQLGDNTTTNRSLPTPVTGTGVLSGKTIVAVTGGDYHALALCSDGTVVAWGSNTYGQLGNNSTTGSSVPVAVNTASGVSALFGKTVVAIAAGSIHSMALCSDGTAVAWGSNGYSQLGDNTATQRNVPVAVNTAIAGSALGGKSVVALAAGQFHSIALCSDGTVAAWGWNNYGQLGDNTTTFRDVPVAVNTASGISALYGKTVLSVVANSTQCLALCSDGSVVAWGSNSNGQLGNNSTTDSLVPVAVNTTSGVSALFGKTVVAIAAGEVHSLALCADGSVAAWGHNYYGELGNNNTTNSSVPVAVNTTSGISALYGKTVVNIAVGDLHTTALCADGTLVAWGYNSYGQLGDGTTTSRSVPVLVSSSTLLTGEQWNKLSTGYGSQQLTLAVAAAPAYATVTTQAVTVIGGTSATVNGTVFAGNSSVAVSFEYGTTTSYGASVTATPALLSNAAATPVSGALTGLLPRTAYHFRIDGNTGTSMINGSDLTFTTLNNNANLAGLVLNGGTLSPVFSSGATAYTVSVPYGSSSVTLAPTLADTNASVQINGVPITSGSTSSAVSLLEGSNTITTRVTAQDGTTIQAYTLTVTRASGPSLASLGLDSGPLSPVFDSNTTGYGVNVSSDTSSIVVTPTVVDGTTTVKVNGTAVTSGSAGNPISLVYGDNVITTAVTSQDGSLTKTYTVLVTRGIPASFAATFASASTIPLTSHGLQATGSTVSLTLNYAPFIGPNLTLVNNTSAGFISGTFDNLAQGQLVAVSYNGVTYHFLANYFGGTGNDLVLVWADSRVFAWGSNSNFQLGLQYGGMVGPAATGGLSQKKIFALAAGATHSLALGSDGSIFAWGSNQSGQAGIGSFSSQVYPPATLSTTNAASAIYGKTVIAIAAGSVHSMALCSDGTVAAWGVNSNGQVGVNALPNFAYPTPVAVDITSGISALYGKTVVAIAAGTSHSLALCSDGTLAAWGSNASGQLGSLGAGTGISTVPVAVNTSSGVSALYGKTVVAISAGASHNLALCSDGTVAAWGANNTAQIGDNTTTNRFVPVAVSTVNGVSALYGKTVVGISAGGGHSLALCSDGTLVSWGLNNSGQLGDNTRASRFVPVNVNAVSTSSAIYGKTVIGCSAGSTHSLAWCSSGTMAAWGLNTSGQVGATSMNTILMLPFAVPRTNFLGSAEAFSGPVTGSSSNHSLTLVATPPATVTSVAATAPTATSAQLNGNVAPNNGYFPISFEFGLTTIYGTSVSGTPSLAAGSQAQNPSATVTGLTPATTYHFRVNGGTYTGADLTFTTLSLLQNWRQTNFGTTANSGSTADAGDYDGDGIPNLLEYALNLNPQTANKLPVTTAMNGANFEYSYSRSTGAVNAGAAFAVEWSDTLAAGSWSGSGVVQTVLSDDGTTQQVKAVIPVNAANAKFVRLSVTAPP